jgi:hypothetical protein
MFNKRVPIGLFAIVIVIVLLAGFTSTQLPQTPIAKAKAAAAANCKSAHSMRMTGGGEIEYELPDVGKPIDLVVVPRCEYYMDGPKRWDVDFIDVYALVTHEQMTQLGFVCECSDDSKPLGIGGAAMAHLVDPDLFMNDTDIRYWVTISDRPTVDHGAPLGSPYSLITGEHFNADLPFQRQEVVYDIGEPIVIHGHK